MLLFASGIERRRFKGVMGSVDVVALLFFLDILSIRFKFKGAVSTVALNILLHPLVVFAVAIFSIVSIYW